MAPSTRAASNVEPVLTAFTQPGEAWTVAELETASTDALLDISLGGESVGRFWIAGHVMQESQPSAIALFAFHAVQQLLADFQPTASQYRPLCPGHAHAQVVSEVYGGLLVHCPAGAAPAKAIMLSEEVFGIGDGELWIAGVTRPAATSRFVGVVRSGDPDVEMTTVASWSELHGLSDRLPGKIKYRWPVDGYVWALDHWGSNPRTQGKRQPDACV